MDKKGVWFVRALPGVESRVVGGFMKQKNISHKMSFCVIFFFVILIGSFFQKASAGDGPNAGGGAGVYGCMTRNLSQQNCSADGNLNSTTVGCGTRVIGGSIEPDYYAISDAAGWALFYTSDGLHGSLHVVKTIHKETKSFGSSIEYQEWAVDVMRDNERNMRQAVEGCEAYYHDRLNYWYSVKGVGWQQADLRAKLELEKRPCDYEESFAFGSTEDFSFYRRPIYYPVDDIMLAPKHSPQAFRRVGVIRFGCQSPGQYIGN